MTAASLLLPQLPGFREEGAWPPVDVPGSLHRCPGGQDRPHLYALRLPAEPSPWISALAPGASPALQGLGMRGRRPGRTLERLVAEVLLGLAAREVWGLELRDMQVVRGRWGKPRLQDQPGAHFNLSHGGGWVLAVLHRRPVGVDVEAEHPAGWEARASVLSETELREHEALPEAARPPDFFRRWTLKESLLKAAGRGLSVDPRTLDFTRSELPPGLGAWEDWHLESLPMPPGVHAALCRAEGAGALEG